MEYFEDEELTDRLVAVYAIGWPLTEEMTAKYPQLKAASGKLDISPEEIRRAYENSYSELKRGEKLL